uniref:Protein DCL, chloroplastic n=1 Tax=Anthurium amnicola TaxID=1678845 RepID=A0A1D1XE16_9ARAE
MADSAAAAPEEIARETEAENAAEPPAAVDMELEAVAGAPPVDGAAAGSEEDPADGVHDPLENGAGKRGRGDGGGEDEEGAKRQKAEKSVEEERLEKLEEVQAAGEGIKEVEKEGVEGGKVEGAPPVKLGPKCFGTSVEMFEYFCKLLHSWSPNIDINRYEHMVFLDLIQNGHPEPDKKIGGGVQAFQVRYHPLWKSRCFFLLRIDGSADDFSFRKCVDHILPLPDHLVGKQSGGNRKGGGHGSGFGGGNGGRGGRGGRWKGGGFGK